MLSLLALVSCSAPDDGNNFVIEGQLVVDRPIKDSTQLFLVPMYGPHPRPVDSVYLDPTGKFRFEGNVEQMATLRLGWRQRYGVEELLVCTEPGTTHVTLGAESRAEGTPQNDSLQQWKEHIAHMRQQCQSFRAIFNMTHDTAQFKADVDQARAELGDYTYRMLTGMGRQKSSMFINSHFVGSLDSLRRAELNTLLCDTTDYTKPQPGFRR